MAARQFIGDLDDDGRLGDVRGQLAVMALIQNMPDDDMVIVSHYRRFLVPRGLYQPPRLTYYTLDKVLPQGINSLPLATSSEFLDIDPSLFASYRSKESFLLLPTPAEAGKSMLDQYHINNHIEDLLLIGAMMVQEKLINSDMLVGMLGRDKLHLAMLYGAPVWLIKKHIYPLIAFCSELSQRLKHHREGNSERYIAYALEVIISELFFRLREQYSSHICECDTLLVIEEGAGFGSADV